MGKRDWYIKLRKGGTKKNPSSGRVVGTRGPYKTRSSAISAGKRVINGYELPTGVKLVVEQGEVGVPKAPAAKKTNTKKKTNPGQWYAYLQHESGSGPLQRFYVGATKAVTKRWINRNIKDDQTWGMGKVEDYYADFAGRKPTDPWFSELPEGDRKYLRKAFVSHAYYYPALRKNNPKRNHPRRKNTHLVKGEIAKFSKAHLDWVASPDSKKWPKLEHNTVAKAKKARFRIDHVHPHSYNVTNLDTGKSTSLGDFQLVAADSRTRKFPGTGYEGTTPRSNPKGKGFSPHFKVGTTVSGTPVYTERLTVTELRKRSPKSKGPIHAREMSDVHLAAAKKSWGALSAYHFSMASAFDNLHSLYQYDIWDKGLRKPLYTTDKEWRQGNIRDELKQARAALDDFRNREGDAQVYQSHYTGKLLPADVREIGKRWDRSARYSRNPNPAKWAQAVDKEMEERGTVGAFTKQARRAGYSDTMEFARKVMEGWRSGKKTVYNKKTRRQQRITQKTMYRANFAINVQRRDNPSLREIGGALARGARAVGSYAVEGAARVGEEGKRAALYAKWKDLEKCANRLGIDLEDLMDGTLDPSETIAEVARRISEAETRLDAYQEEIAGKRAARKTKRKPRKQNLIPSMTRGPQRNPYFPKPAYAAKKRRQYKMNPRTNGGEYRAFVRTQMPRLRRDGHLPTDAMKIINQMWNRKKKQRGSKR